MSGKVFGTDTKPVVRSSAQETEIVPVPKGKISLKHYFLHSGVEIIGNVAEWMVLYNKENKTLTDLLDYFDLNYRLLGLRLKIRRKFKLSTISGPEEGFIASYQGKVRLLHIKCLQNEVTNPLRKPLNYFQI